MELWLGRAEVGYDVSWFVSAIRERYRRVNSQSKVHISWDGWYLICHMCHLDLYLADEQIQPDLFSQTCVYARQTGTPYDKSVGAHP